MSSGGVSDQTKKILIGAAVATATVGAGYVLYKAISSSPSDLAAELQKIKAEGNERFKEKNYIEAAKIFSKGIQIGEEKQSENGLVAMLYQNRAACREKIGDSPFDILNDCLSAVKNDKKYAKAYLRASKNLHAVGKLKDALTYLLAAFILDDKLNKSNFEFFDQLLNVDINEYAIEPIKEILEKKPLPVSLFRIQQWWDTWDIVDLFKMDAIAFVPENDNAEEINYRKALDHIKSQEYEQVLEVLGEDVSFLPAMILRLKFLSYSATPNLALDYSKKVEIAMSENTEENFKRKALIREAFDISHIEIINSVDQLEEYLKNVTNDEEKSAKCNLYAFAALYIYNGCVLSSSTPSHEQQLVSDTTNTAKMITIASEAGTLTPHLKMVSAFINMCSTNDYGALHQSIMEMETIVQNTPTHFCLILMAKVYMMTGNAASSEKLLKEAAKINVRYLIASRFLQQADLHVQKPEDERLRNVTECAKEALKVDEFNFSANILLLLGSNGAEPSIKREKYEESMMYIRRAAIFAPPREMLMLKRMLPLMNAKRRAAELIGIY